MSKEHHHHDHTGSEHTDLDKLRILLPHWIEHNDEHAASFEGWAEKARVLGQAKAAQQIEEVAERMAACNQSLAAALEALEE
ncbi:MAG: hypothetical protein B6I35_10335 [Anaerolineaceae bacterium 4572_32.2]|nr:MAG: hypothetical protein B6I35_10335 [Anaerolineaceae bacterium 4572_32.2]HEY74485.1 hypothetical protein [Thermoflexia bacterium]